MHKKGRIAADLNCLAAEIHC